MNRVWSLWHCEAKVQIAKQIVVIIVMLSFPTSEATARVALDVMFSTLFQTSWQHIDDLVALQEKIPNSTKGRSFIETYILPLRAAWCSTILFWKEFTGQCWVTLAKCCAPVNTYWMTAVFPILICSESVRAGWKAMCRNRLLRWSANRYFIIS